MTHIKLTEIALYNPAHTVENDYFIDHFAEKGKDIQNLLLHLGRQNRYRIKDSGETGVTMAVESSKEVLRKAGLTGEDIDLLIYSTQVPEHSLPMNALFVHQAIKGKNRMLAYDLNANCAGMTMAVEQASRTMLSNPRIKRALIVGSDHFSPILNPEDEVAYPFFGDLSVAVILEKTDETTGFIDAIHYMDSTDPTNMMFPAEGLTQLVAGNSHAYMKTRPFDDSEMYPHVYDSIRELLDQYDLSPSDVKCCFSQSNKANLDMIQEEIGFSNDHMIFVGDQFGYPGTSSPFLALHEGIQTGKIKRGDHVLFWTIGTGYEFITMLYKY